MTNWEKIVNGNHFVGLGIGHYELPKEHYKWLKKEVVNAKKKSIKFNTKLIGHIREEYSIMQCEDSFESFLIDCLESPWHKTVTYSTLYDILPDKNKKSFYLDIRMSTTKENLSPMIELDRKSVVAFTNRLNKIDSASDMGVAALQGDYVSSEAVSGDKNEGIYITRKVALDNPAVGIQVILDMNRLSSANVKLMYKILRSDDASDFDEIGYRFFNTTGGPDEVVNASTTDDDFKEYKYTAGKKSDGSGEELDEFIAFAVKIVLQGSNSAEAPRIKDLRCIALAT